MQNTWQHVHRGSLSAIRGAAELSPKILSNQCPFWSNCFVIELKTVEIVCSIVHNGAAVPLGTTTLIRHSFNLEIFKCRSSF